MDDAGPWPRSEEELVAAQGGLAAAAETAWATTPAVLPSAPLLGGCFVAHAAGEAGPGHAGDRAWAAAVVWQPVEPVATARRADDVLRRRGGEGGPRQASDAVAQAVVGGRVPARYTAGLLALRARRSRSRKRAGWHGRRARPPRAGALADHAAHAARGPG